MARKARKISDLMIDEISLVDKGANQHAVVTIAKSADGENKEKEMEIFDEQGNPLDVADLSEGDTVYDADGNAYVMTLEDDEDMDERYAQLEEEYDPVPVGKSFTFPAATSSNPAAKDFAVEIREELSKALTDKEREEIISKALGKVGELAEQVEIAKRAAEAERSARLDREYTEIAKSYNLPIEDEVLGGVLRRCAENLPVEDCEIISKCLQVAGQAFMEEYGYEGGGDNSDVMTQVENVVANAVSKSAGDVSEAEALAEYFSTHPEAYDEYLAEKLR